MRKLCTILFTMMIFLPLMAYSTPVLAQQNEPAVDPSDPEAIVRAQYDALNAGDLDGSLAYLADGAVAIVLPPSPGAESTFVGKEAYRQGNTFMLSTHTHVEFSDIQVHGNAVIFTALLEDDALRELGVSPITYSGTSIVQDGLLQSETWVMTSQSIARLEAAVSFQDAVGAGNEAFMASFADGDAAALSALYTDEGQALPPNEEIATGHEAVQVVWQGVMDSGATEVTLETLEAHSSGEIGYEAGEFTILAGDQTVDEGKYIIIWKLEDGQWKLHRSIWNSSRPLEN
jgi:ketosteroid isomerase-like protein